MSQKNLIDLHTNKIITLERETSNLKNEISDLRSELRETRETVQKLDQTTTNQRNEIISIKIDLGKISDIVKVGAFDDKKLTNFMNKLDSLIERLDRDSTII